MQKHRLLLAEDDITLGKLIKESLDRLNYEVVWVTNGIESLKQINKQTDLCILDVMMPGKDGWSVAKEVKKNYPEIPVIFLTALSETKDLVKGYEAGANDYLRKPFSIDELHLRVKELLKRNKTDSEQMKVGAYLFDIHRQELIFENHQIIKLSYKEAELLKRLFFHKNELLSKIKVLKELWGDDNFFTSRNLDVYITKLRKKLSLDNNIEIINVRGFGYKLLIKENRFN
ncbi:hypothetical protein BEI02_00235 [Elizabethkingia sp. HvH-WGS333]|uniref:response regulator transcription factor n=1 Tax=Elizabethkingia TaxID=308865 RepID=UPI0007415D6D|nr:MULTISPECIES: response regulator transcription factor [Elizabethkingia]KUG11556.1 hypothetical protein AMC91_14025 [Elizabethkingia miricola]MCL1657584.1 response regulator transcription factor [Elizabethkingia miricola]MCP1250259.1 response regulator transcription factor [Elizabethkingia sp. S0634]OIK48320.1 hypothetical protein BEI02_00235 [Elizabethkingia sp. HvH-WGS333]